MSIDESNDPKLTNKPTQDSEPQNSQPYDGALMLAADAGSPR